MFERKFAKKRLAVEAVPQSRRGRIAATYVGLVDRVDIESNIRAMLAQH